MKKVFAGENERLKASMAPSARKLPNPLNVFALLKVLEAVLDSPKLALKVGVAIDLFVSNFQSASLQPLASQVASKLRENTGKTPAPVACPRP